jgi:hypothetical protein
MRGFEPEELIGHNGINENDISPFIYPLEEDIERVGVTGHYLSNFFNWEGKVQGEKMIKEWGFKPVSYPRERTFFQYAKIEDHANDVHDYLKYLKYGYGRATDDASMEIRHGRMTREEGMELVRRYDSVTPSTLPLYCKLMGISIADFYNFVEPFRDKNIWERDKKNEWRPKSSVWEQNITSQHKKARISLSSDRTFSNSNKHLYFNKNNPPEKTGVIALDEYPSEYSVI